MIFIDSPASIASFWTAFERDLAIRKLKPMLRFDAAKNQLLRYEMKPPKLMVAHLYHPGDSADVSKIMQWLVDERSFEAFDNPKLPPHTQIPPFSRQEADKRDQFLFSVRSFGAIYLLFLSPMIIGDSSLLAHAAQQAAQHPRSTFVCWLEPFKHFWPTKQVRALRKVPKDRAFAFSRRPCDPHFNSNELDDLSVRLFWLIYQSRPGDWFR